MAFNEARFELLGSFNLFLENCLTNCINLKPDLGTLTYLARMTVNEGRFELLGRFNLFFENCQMLLNNGCLVSGARFTWG